MRPAPHWLLLQSAGSFPCSLVFHPSRTWERQIQRAAPGNTDGGSTSVAASLGAGTGDGSPVFSPPVTEAPLHPCCPVVAVAVPSHSSGILTVARASPRYAFSHSVWPVTFTVRCRKQLGGKANLCVQGWASVWIRLGSWSLYT